MILYSINFVILLLLAILLIVVFILKIVRYDRLKHKASRKFQDANDQVALREINMPVEMEAADYVEAKSVGYSEPKHLNKQTEKESEDVRLKEEKTDRLESIIVFICIILIAFVFILHVYGYPASVDPKIIGWF